MIHLGRYSIYVAWEETYAYLAKQDMYQKNTQHRNHTHTPHAKMHCMAREVETLLKSYTQVVLSSWGVSQSINYTFFIV